MPAVARLPNLVGRRGWLAPGVLGGAPLVAVVAFGVSRDGDDRELFIARLLFWSLPLLLLVVLAAAIWRFRAAAAPWVALRAAWPAAGYAALLSAALLCAVPPTMRTQFDETSLAGVAQNLHRLQLAVMTTGAIPYEGGVLPLENTVDKRPPLFAFLVAMMHGAAGYRPANAFAVNAALLWLGLFLAARLAAVHLGRCAGVAAPLCLLSVPLLGAVATSGGFELMACVWLAVAVLAARDFTTRPDDPRCAAFVGATLLLAWSRYESLLAALVLALPVAWLVRGRYRPSRPATLLLACTPALCAPLGFLLALSRNPKFYPEALGQPLLAAGHAVAHLGPLAAALFDPSPAGALPGPLSWLAAAGLFALWRRRRPAAGDVLVALPVVAVTAAALAWFYGDVREPTALRLYLPLAALVALLPLALFVGLGSRPALGLALALAVHAGWRVRELAQGRALPDQSIAALTSELDRVAARLPGAVADTLWVGTAAQYLIVQGRAALSPAAFERNWASLAPRWRRGEIATIYLLATPIDAAMAPAMGDVEALLVRAPTEIVERGIGSHPVTVYRLRR